MKFRMLEQKRAEYAWKCIKEVKKLSSMGLDEKGYRSQARKLPSMIMHNGLITTLAFLKSKAEVNVKSKKINDEALILFQITRYLHDENEGHKEATPENVEQALNDDEGYYACFFEKLINATFSEYRHETMKAIRLAVWLKRIAEGELEDEDQ